MGFNFLAIFAVTLFTICSTVLGQTNLVPINFTTNWNPTADGCVDSSGFLSCYNTKASASTTCIDACAASSTKDSPAYNTCAVLCKKAWLADNLSCWLQSCWNQVYSCGYQLTALSYFDGSGEAQNSDVPFYPPPPSASAGACSCNLGDVYGNYTAVSTAQQGTSCEVIAAGIGGAPRDNTTFYDCSCCDLSWPISNILNTCPTSDLTVVNLQSFITQIAGDLTPSPDKCAILKNGSEICIDKYNYPWDANATAYNPLSLPSGKPGKDPLSNTAGNAFTNFPMASPTLILGGTYTTSFTPATFAASASADSQSIVGTSIMGKPTPTPTFAPTTSRSATPTPTSKSGAGLTNERSSVGLLLAGALVLGLL